MEKSYLYHRLAALNTASSAIEDEGGVSVIHVGSMAGVSTSFDWLCILKAHFGPRDLLPFQRAWHIAADCIPPEFSISKDDRCTFRLEVGLSSLDVRYVLEEFSVQEVVRVAGLRVYEAFTLLLERPGVVLPG